LNIKKEDSCTWEFINIRAAKMSVVASQSRLEEADSTLFESNEDLYAVFKALQRQEEFLDIQVPKISNDITF
jgi:hypothetical protein